ncbi:hypothetical protein NEAUS03_0279 [Nematocida ausubeli]|nr:hypothetical protein NEAUS03_0279 [Nematocida ausubeli]
MLDRKHIVPEVYDHLETNEDTLADENNLAHRVDVCLDQLESVRSNLSLTSSPSSVLKLEIETLFMDTDSKMATEMERIAIILCRIAHRIIRAEALSETDYSMLLQIFELGLFLAQFKDRWLSSLEKSRALQANGWSTQKEFISPGPLFSSARELISLAQEYILRQSVLSGNRCDLCAYALANINGVYAPSLSLLLHAQKEEKVHSPNPDAAEAESGLEPSNTNHAIPLDYFYFLLYNMADLSESKSKILAKWVNNASEELDLTVLYLPQISTQLYFKDEIQRMKNLEEVIGIVQAANTHAILSIHSVVIHSHRKGKLQTRDLSELLINTYTKEGAEYTIQILQAISKYNPVAAESLTKSLIIIGGAIEIAKYFFKTAFIIDRDYAESCILCSSQIEHIPKNMLRLLCDSDYFRLLCEEKNLFQQIVKTVSEEHSNKAVVTRNNEVTIRSYWDIGRFCERVFLVQNITIESLEKGLLLMLYFPDMSLKIKKIVWDEIDKKGMYAVGRAVDSLISAIYMSNGLEIKKSGEEKEQQREVSIDKSRFSVSVSDEIDHIIDVLNHYREIPSVQKQLLKLAKCLGVFSILFSAEPDAFTIKCICREVKKLKKDSKRLHEFIMQLKERNELHCDSYWFTQAKKQISLGGSIRLLRPIMQQNDMLYLLNNEEDIVYLLRLISKRSVPDIDVAASLLEKLEVDSPGEVGLVLGSRSSISMTVPSKNKPITAYLMLTQKEFTGRQSVFKASNKNSEFEVFIKDGMLMTYSKKVIKDKNHTVEEVECKVEHVLNQEADSTPGVCSRGGWAISMGITLTSKQCVLVIGDVSIKSPHGIKPTELVIGEEFKGVLNRALILEESYKKGRLSSRPGDAYYIENIVSIERACQYYNRFGVLIDSLVPYVINGSTKVRMINVLKGTTSQWRVSERLCRHISKLSAKHYQIEEVLHSNVLPPATLTEYLIK